MLFRSSAKGIGLIDKVGSEAIRQATEMAIMQSGDEVSKMILNDPNTSAETAIGNIGLASALGGTTGAFVRGAVSPLWKATVGPKAEEFLGNMVNRLNGTASSEASELATRAGVPMDDVMRAYIDGTPMARSMFSGLEQTDSKIAGRAAQKIRQDFEENLTRSTVEIGRAHV